MSWPGRDRLKETVRVCARWGHLTTRSKKSKSRNAISRKNVRLSHTEKARRTNATKIGRRVSPTSQNQKRERERERDNPIQIGPSDA